MAIFERLVFFDLISSQIDRGRGAGQPTGYNRIR